ncbi:Protein kinase [Phytophthora megakarya]|uniref:non-specific serine/threonine protein kinase n=1 Tax=Phytophthora megakarya TaxID=4795 RepID=A0A225UKH1_9STRA|nr:Protein kinase [Phytophthora megakarya]
MIIKECGMLNTSYSPSLLIDTLLIVSQLARSSQTNYDCILKADLLTEFYELMQHPESMVRAKALNCIGNLCRHSTLFYEHFISPLDKKSSNTILGGIIRGLSDPDNYVRRFACFAIGNAAFHNDDLYDALRPAIPLLVQNLHSDEDKTRSNAGGALGNLVRNSDEFSLGIVRIGHDGDYISKKQLCPVLVPEDNEQVFDDMLQDIDDIYVDVDALFVETGLYSLPCPSRRRDTKSNVTNGQFLELLQRHLVPFDLRTTTTAMWGVLRQTSMVQKFSQRIQFHAHHIEETANTMKTSFYVETVNVGDVKGAQFRKVVRKYVETDCVVFICKNLMELIVHGKGNTSGFYTKTTLCLVVRNEKYQPSEISYIDSHFSATRHDQGLPITRLVRTSVNLDIGIAAWDEAISSIAHQVESMAIDESFTTPVVSIT